MADSGIPHFKPSKELRDIHVMVVDDDARIAKLVRSVLLGLGFQNIHVCHEGTSAIAYLDEHRIDMMICDWQMEPMDGLTMVEYLRGQKNNPNFRVPIIMLSGNTEKPQVEAARDAGVTEYVVKPFTAKSLCSRITSVVDNPRSFIQTKGFTGHNRRRKSVPVKQGRRQSDK